MGHAQLSPPPPIFTSSPPSSGTSVLVLAISILGILTISLLLLVYYLFATKCFHILQCRSGTRTASQWQLFDQYDDHVMHTSRTAVSGRGLNESSIQSIPTIFYKKHSHDKKLSFHECAVCINEFQEGEKIRLLPNCFHVFHLDCIDVWLQSNANCPLCRAPINACPMALANLVGPTGQEDANENNNDIVLDIRDDELHVRGFQPRGSMGDECIDIRRKEEDLGMVPMRRSFSMDSSNDRRLYLALQKIVRQNSFACQEVAIDRESSSSGTSSVTGKLRRGFFSFNQNKCSRSAVLPI
ncbi:RING-H2 finger protein ATL1 [Rhynchospora pubera]|uniref:RING-type E3 ubiquitin transferase n=1 Tax=Rhynchospora pubera TaxID=906938 RepID=A0AAV8GHN4_9POAL|nr:RING-H2 finger protein ATL1 [Rhynchospora pubera]